MPNDEDSLGSALFGMVRDLTAKVDRLAEGQVRKDDIRDIKDQMRQAVARSELAEMKINADNIHARIDRDVATLRADTNNRLDELADETEKKFQVTDIDHRDMMDRVEGVQKGRLPAWAVTVLITVGGNTITGLVVWFITTHIH